jgi:hypothetical protein
MKKVLHICTRGIWITALAVMLTLLCSTGNVSAQCPVDTVDLRGSDDSVIVRTWARTAKCCSASGPDACVSLVFIPDTGAWGISVSATSGLTDYYVNCGPVQSVPAVMCFPGNSTFTGTFCKPGANSNTYTITSIPKHRMQTPVVLYASRSCPALAAVSGWNQSTIQWRSLGAGVHENYLSCKDGCDTALITPPATGAPTTVSYRITGLKPNTCDAIRDTLFLTVNFVSNPSVTISPGSTSACPGETKVLTATPSGGRPPYTYLWSTGATTSSITAPAGTYIVTVRDSLSCFTQAKDTVVVTALPAITVNAGSDTAVCSNKNYVNLRGTVTNALGGTWSGGTGRWLFADTILNNRYVPSPAEITAGSVKLVLSSRSNFCAVKRDTVTITLNTAPTPVINGPKAVCEGLTSSYSTPFYFRKQLHLDCGRRNHTFTGVHDHGELGSIWPRIPAPGGNRFKRLYRRCNLFYYFKV